MQPDDIQLTDWMRILFGKTGGVFFIELVLRVAVIYTILLVSMRLMGKRLASRLSASELVAIVSLAAAIGIPMQNPERGLIPGLIVASVVVFIQRLMARLATRGGRSETLTEGSVSVLLADAVLRYREMKKTRITRERLFAHLRGEGIRSLGEVSRVYLEANGSFSIVKSVPAQPGLSILPSWDEEFRRKQPVERGRIICGVCGNPARNAETAHTCENCAASMWLDAVR